MRQHIILLLTTFISCLDVCAHSGFILHGEDIMAVLGLANDSKLFNRSKDTKNNHSWVKFISSDMIDDTSFHKQLEEKHNGFKIKSPNTHRLLFHWAYDTEPWSDELERKVREYCDVYDLNVESNIRIFKAEILSEQRRRNREIIKKTKEVFKFEERLYAHFFASMAYNIHILGDYMTDNSVLEGLYAFDKLIGRIVVGLRNLDFVNSKPLVKGITRINNQNINIQEKANLMMEYLKAEVPSFLKRARNGSVKRKLEGAGYMFVAT